MSVVQRQVAESQLRATSKFGSSLFLWLVNCTARLLSHIINSSALQCEICSANNCLCWICLHVISRCSVHWAVYTVLCVHWAMHTPVFTVQCTVHCSVHTPVFSALCCALCTVHCSVHAGILARQHLLARRLVQTWDLKVVHMPLHWFEESYLLFMFCVSWLWTPTFSFLEAAMIHLGNQTVWPLSFMSGVEALYPPAVLGKGSPALHQPFTLSFQSMQCHGQLFQGSLRNPKMSNLPLLRVPETYLAWQASTKRVRFLTWCLFWFQIQEYEGENTS